MSEIADIEVIECAQGSAEWHQYRVGLITASMFSVIRDRLKTGPNKGGYKKAAQDYAFRIAIERLGGQPLDEGFETWAMRRGNELEPVARDLHAFRIGKQIEHAGLVRTTDLRFGASADGLIGDDGGSEYKCLIAPDRLRTVLVDRNLDEFKDQVQGCLWLTGRQWWHFVLYCPALEAVNKELFIQEVRRDDDYIADLENDLIEFDGLVCEYMDRIQSAETHFPLSEAA